MEHAKHPQISTPGTRRALDALKDYGSRHVHFYPGFSGEKKKITHCTYIPWLRKKETKNGAPQQGKRTSRSFYRSTMPLEPRYLQLARLLVIGHHPVVHSR